MTTEAVAFGIHRIASASVARAVTAVTSEQGRDPRDFVLVAFGGSGPVHAATVARALHIARIIVPPASGVFSALGLLFSSPERHVTRSMRARLDMAELTNVEHAFAAIEAAQAAPAHVTRRIELRYAGQDSSLFVDLPGATSGWQDHVARAFAAAHLEAFGYDSPDEPIEIVGIRATLRDAADTAWQPERLAYTARPIDLPAARRAYFGSEAGWLDAPVLARSAIGPEQVQGPLIVEEYETTVVVPPGFAVSRQAWDVLVIDDIGGDHAA